MSSRAGPELKQLEKQGWGWRQGAKIKPPVPGRVLTVERGAKDGRSFAGARVAGDSRSERGGPWPRSSAPNPDSRVCRATGWWPPNPGGGTGLQQSRTAGDGGGFGARVASASTAETGKESRCPRKEMVADPGRWVGRVVEGH